MSNKRINKAIKTISEALKYAPKFRVPVRLLYFFNDSTPMVEFVYEVLKLVGAEKDWVSEPGIKKDVSILEVEDEDKNIRVQVVDTVAAVAPITIYGIKGNARFAVKVTVEVDGQWTKLSVEIDSVRKEF